jgi:hypothetical protein
LTEYWRDDTVPLSVAVMMATTFDVHQPLAPLGCAGSSVAATVGGTVSATPAPTKVSRSTTTPPVDVT